MKLLTSIRKLTKFDNSFSKKALSETADNAARIAAEKIEAAIEKGLTRCIINESQNRLPIATIKRVLKAGFDIRFSYFKDGDQWFFKADWSDASCGKIWNFNNEEVSLEELIKMLS